MDEPAGTGIGPRRKPRLNRRQLRGYLDRSDWALAVFALAFLVAYAWPILDPTIPRAAKQVCDVVTLVTWLVFALDYLARVWSARDRRQYFLRHLLDLVIVALPILRPLRLMRLVVLFRVVNRKAAATLRGRVPLYVSVSAGTLIFCAALAILDAERRAPGSNIHNFGTAVWWAVVTVTTVGYGDHFPVTVEGRFIAGALMFSGIALIGVVTASFAAWFIDRVRDDESAVQAATQRDLDQIVDRLDILTKEMTSLRKSLEGSASLRR